MTPSVFSNFENTAPHVKVFAKSFCKSDAYLIAEPLTVNLSGAREWYKLWDFIEIIRIPEALDEYRKNGLPFLRYIYCKNYALRKFFPSIFKIPSFFIE